MDRRQEYQLIELNDFVSAAINDSNSKRLNIYSDLEEGVEGVGLMTEEVKKSIFSTVGEISR